MLDSFVTWAEVDLDAIAHNVRAFQSHAGPDVEVFAVVKANAYGHGAAPVARAALESGATRLAVHRAIEGVQLRRAGLVAPVLVMGYTPPAAAAQVVEWRLTPSLITMAFAQALSDVSLAAGVRTPVHLKIDTGMNRYGLQPQEVVDFARALIELPGIALEGIFTHFATADSADQTHLRSQLKDFEAVLASLHQAGIAPPLVHACNSAASMRLPEGHFNAIRPGISLYGMDPSAEWPPVFPLQPALTLKSRVSRVRDLPSGAGISYGRTYVTGQPERAALVSVGYGDGYHRILSNRSQVLVGGRRAPLRGRVCMDQFVVDVTGIPNVRQDDEVVLVGRQGDEQIRAEEVAAWCGTINYEVTTGLLPRVTRVYLRGGAVVAVDSLDD